MNRIIRDLILNTGLNSGWFVTNLSQPRFVEYVWILNNLEKKSGKLLDVGFGKFPVFPLQMAALGYDAYGIDMVDEMHPIFKKIAITQDFKITIADITKTKEYPENYFDIITCVSTIEHVPDDLAVMDAMRKILKQDGVLFLTTFYGCGQVNKEIYDYKTKKGKGWRIYDKDSLKALTKNFKILEAEYFVPVGKSWKMTTEEDCSRYREGLICIKLKK